MLSKYGSIYKISNNVNDKCYVGLTRGYVCNRWYQHKKSAKTNISSALYSAIRKYGEDNFFVEEIACSISPESLCDLEVLLISQHNTYGKSGYNLSRGGESSYERVMSDEGKLRLRVARNKPESIAKQKKINKEFMQTEKGKRHQSMMVDKARLAKDKLKASRKIYAATSKGKDQLISASNLGAKKNAELYSKAVIVGGQILSSITDAAKHFNIDRALVRYRINSNGFPDWKYVNGS